MAVPTTKPGPMPFALPTHLAVVMGSLLRTTIDNHYRSARFRRPKARKACHHFELQCRGRRCGNRFSQLLRPADASFS
jgi:hypothetical protein